MRTPSKFRQYPYKGYHIAFWVFYMLLSFASHQGYGRYLEVLLLSLAYTVFTGLASYINIYYLFHQYLAKRKFIAYALLFLLLIIICSALISISYYLIFSNQSQAIDRFLRKENLIDATLISTLFIVTFFSAVVLVEKWFTHQHHLQALQQEKLQSEIQFLKSQLNPHFLFNAINSIYFLIEKNPVLAADTLLKFSEMLRYQLYECEGEKVSIEKELLYLMHYIGLEKIRRGNRVQVKQQISSTIQGFEIAPLLLLPFVENAFKYVSNFKEAENEINLSLDAKGGMLHFHIDNTKDSLSTVPSLQTAKGIGLTNIKRRLELLYNNRYDLDIKELENRYSVNLIIKY